MIEPLSPEELRKLATLLRTLTASFDWSKSKFDIRKSACLSLLSQLAYCSTLEAERGNRRRAKLVPCELFQRAVATDIDLVQVIRQEDFQAFGVLYGRASLAMLIRIENVILIGVRGTQFAYDRRLDARVSKQKWEIGGRSERIHRGFLSEALVLSPLIGGWLRDNDVFQDSKLEIYISGHSLGGGIAAVLHQTGFHVENRSDWSNGCYTFGAPKIADIETLAKFNQPYAVRRAPDIVPNLPPDSFGYACFFDQRTTAEDLFYAPDEGVSKYASWLWRLVSGEAAADHSIEKYHNEIFQAANARYGSIFSERSDH